MANERMEDYQALVEVNNRLKKQVEELTAEKKRKHLEKVTKMYRKVSKGLKIAAIVLPIACGLVYGIGYPAYKEITVTQCWYVEDHDNPWDHDVCHQEPGKDPCFGQWTTHEEAYQALKAKGLEECK